LRCSFFFSFRLASSWILEGELVKIFDYSPTVLLRRSTFHLGNGTMGTGENAMSRRLRLCCAVLQPEVTLHFQQPACIHTVSLCQLLPHSALSPFPNRCCHGHTTWLTISDRTIHFKNQFHNTVLDLHIKCFSSGSIVSDYGLDDRAIEVRSPTGVDFSSSPYVQTGSGAHPASYPMGTGGSFPGGKARPGRDADHSPPSSAGVKNE
jgi:hypothetical protein